ncbi:hypothetical protein LGK95_21445 [Clostridium algoriphilum]|uniref:hypothetical protein n=1 Tax=Clostridium algoriphilum TaxID=198347 RepID=UPI001CF3B359|nr:hypothetical protein [Clostridium algoriphilum]MCB2296019.1 hypothetical protein [Clostridium algoriphilum]
MYCEYIKKEIQLIKKNKLAGMNKFVYECSENYKDIGGVITKVGCKFHFSDNCLQLNNRVQNK